MAYPTEVVQFARDLFFVFDEFGERKHSYQQISDLIREKCPGLAQYPDPSTVQRWATKKDLTGSSWELQWKRGNLKGIVDAEDEMSKYRNIAEGNNKWEEKIAEVRSSLQMIGLDLIIKGHKPVKDSKFEPKDVDEGLRMIDRGIKVVNLTNEETEEKEDKVINIHFKRSDKPPVNVVEIDAETEQKRQVIEDPKADGVPDFDPKIHLRNFTEDDEE